MTEKRKKKPPKVQQVGIQFKFKVEPSIVYGDHPFFDKSELALFSQEQRKQVWFEVMPMTAKKQREITEESTYVVMSRDDIVRKIVRDLDLPEAEKLMKIVYALGLLSEEKRVDQEQVSSNTMDYAVRRWSGILNDNGSAMKCTLENKLNLFDGGYPLTGLALINISRNLMSKHELFQKRKQEDSEKN